MRRLYRTLYRVGFTPWDSAEVPAPVRLAAGRTPGRAVDLGCGTGAQARYLAEHGWAVTAADFVASAIAAARRADPEGRVTWRVGDVTDVSTVDPDGRSRNAVDLILDNGCLHGLADADRPAWVGTVEALAAAGATLLVRAAPRRRRGVGPRGLDGDELRRLIGNGWHEYPTERGWYRFARAAAEGQP
jgi:SAM-dependent methyltransferase